VNLEVRIGKLNEGHAYLSKGICCVCQGLRVESRLLYLYSSSVSALDAEIAACNMPRNSGAGLFVVVRIIQRFINHLLIR
jgi:hypothetical protein